MQYIAQYIFIMYRDKNWGFLLDYDYQVRNRIHSSINMIRNDFRES